MCAALLLGLGLGSSQFFSISVAADADAGAGGRPWCQPQLMPSYSFFFSLPPLFLPWLTSPFFLSHSSAWFTGAWAMGDRDGDRD